jgi:hypothetical protein
MIVEIAQMENKLKVYTRNGDNELKYGYWSLQCWILPCGSILSMSDTVTPDLPM